MDQANFSTTIICHGNVSAKLDHGHAPPDHNIKILDMIRVGSTCRVFLVCFINLGFCSQRFCSSVCSR